MKRILLLVIALVLGLNLSAQQRRPVDSEHPMWLIHVDVWNKADPQKIIDLIPEKIRPYVVMNLSLSCGYDTERQVYKMPQNAMKTYKSWGTVCQHNGMWFTCQPASGGHTHLQDDDLETFEYMYKAFPNFLGWNYAEQFWGFNEVNDLSSSSDVTRIALFAKLVEMAHNYGGFLTISFCGNIWSHPLNPVGMMKRNADLLAACQKYPEAILWLYKYTTSSCFYNNESVTWSPYVAGLAKNYGVRYDNCGWNGALDDLLGENHGKKYPNSAGYGTVMEQTCVNGGAVWDGPELIWTEDFQNLSNTTNSVNHTVRNWGLFGGFQHGWLDMFSKIIDGTMYIPTREEVVKKTKIYVINDITSGNDEAKYAAWGDLYDGLYKQDDPFNRGDGQWMNNYCYFKKTGRYGAIPVGIAPYDSLAKAIPTKVKKSSKWTSESTKVSAFNKSYDPVSTGDLYVNRFKNQLVTYTPYTYLNSKKSASALIPLQYNTCNTLKLVWGKLSTGMVHEYADHIDFYLNNYRSDTTTNQLDEIIVSGATSEPTITYKRRTSASNSATVTSSWDGEKGVYTVKVNHNGAIDLSINCSGTATDRSTDTVSQVALEIPEQPVPYVGPITIEAEDMNYMDVASCVTDPYNWYKNVYGHAGNGFIDFGTKTTGSLQHTIKLRAEQAGDYRVIVRYSNVSQGGKIKLLKGSTIRYAVVEPTGVSEWRRAEVKFTLNKGNNTIYIKNPNGINMYIDNITYMPVSMEDEKYAVVAHPVEHGRVELSSETAAEGDTVTVRVYPDAGYTLKGWNIIHGGLYGAITFPVSNEFTFVMPDDNVVFEPVYEDNTIVYELDYSTVLSGTVPPGWRCDMGGEIHDYPNSYTSGARVFTGFTGYQGKALYWRDKSCEYGKQADYPLILEPGSYIWTFATAAWKEAPKYDAKVLSSTGTAVASKYSLSATPNANGSFSANLSSAKVETFEFDIKSKGNYVLQFLNKDVVSGLDEFLLLKCQLRIKPEENGIFEISDEHSAVSEIYSLDGRRVISPLSGVNLIRAKDGSSKKIILR